MNNSDGLDAMMKLPTSISTFSLLMDCGNLKMKAVLLQVLAAVCFVPPNGHNLVLDAFTNYFVVKKEKARFITLVNDLKEDDVEYNVSIFTLNHKGRTRYIC
jgi:hypothetical protein